MWAVTLPTFGGPEALVWAEFPDPVPGADDVVIDVRAAGVNHADLLQRRGRYPGPPGTTDVPGLECSGIVAAVGPQVEHWHVGDEVCALLPGGGYAERVAVSSGQVLPAPRGVPLTHAASLPEAGCTVWSTIFATAGLEGGQTLLIHGGASGIGTFAIQLARALDVRVIVTAGSEAKCRRTRELGADLAVNYRTDDFVAAVKDHTGGRGVNVILDVVGGDYLARNIEALAPDGWLVVIGTLGGRRAELDFRALMAKRGTVYSAGLRARPPEQKATIVADVRENVWPLIESGAIRPVIEAEVAMSEAAKAHQMLEAG